MPIIPTPEQIDSIKKLQGLVFDCDGVLLNSRLANISFYNHLRSKAGLPPLSAEQEEYVHMSTYEQALDYILEGSECNNISSYLDEMESSFDYYNLLMVENDLVPMLDWLKATAFPLGICTNRPSPLGHFLARFGLDGYFKPMQTASNSTAKPHPDGLFKVAAAWGIAPENLAYIGDSLVDELAAKAAGMPLWSFKNLDLDAVLHIPNFKVLHGWLESYLRL